MAHRKAATQSDLDKAAALMKRIREERPEFWPYGLNPGMFEPGDLFLIQKTAAEEPVGFVGWQERTIGDQRVGMYAIGVLPAYRGQGIAKEAVTQVVSERSKNVDRVAAFVAPGNIPSEKLAASLGIPLLNKSAGAFWSLLAKYPKTMQGGMALAGGGATAAAYDQFMPKQEGVGFLDDAARKTTAVMNFLTGAAGMLPAGSILKNRAAHGARFKWPKSQVNAAKAGIGTGIFGVPLVKVHLGQQKSIAESTDQNAQEANRIQELALKIKDKVKDTTESGSVLPWLLGAGVVTAGLGYGAHRLAKAVESKSTQDTRGKLRVTLPTQNPGDSETTLELPFDQEKALTDNLRHRLELDTRRRLYAESKERIRRRKQINPRLPFQTISV